MIAALLICAACGTHAVPAATTDAAITGDRPSQPNRVWAPPPGERRHQLLVHFPGSAGGTGSVGCCAVGMGASLIDGGALLGGRDASPAGGFLRGSPAPLSGSMGGRPTTPPGGR